MMQPERKKNRSNDIVLVLKPINGRPKATTGLVDPRLFTGENRFRVIQEPNSTLWFAKYDKGIVPLPLKQKFTSYGRIMEHVTKYFKGRDIEIAEVLD